MKKRVFIIFIIFLFILVFPLTNGIYISGEATSNQINASITVVSIAPTISIFSPKENRTYRSQNILLNYSVYDADGISLVWYNIDNETNISLGNSSSGQTYFNTSEGNHILYLYANDTQGTLSSKSVRFFANNSKIIVIYENFRQGKRGNSTDFDLLSDEELENLSGMTLENTDYGKILWLENVNVTADVDPNDRITTLDYNVVIANSSIFVNETGLPNLNKKATLWFYNLNFKNPRVLRNGIPCSADICSGQSYVDGIFQVNVTGFTNYTVGETEEEKEKGGGGGVTLEENFILDRENIHVSLKQGETKTEFLQIKNTGKKNLNIEVEITKIQDFVKISETTFSLNAGETKTLTLDFIARQDTVPQLYMGKIIFKSSTITKEVLVAVDIESKGPLLDVELEIPEKYLEIFPGGDLMAVVTLHKIGETGKPVDVLLEYTIKNHEIDKIVYERETVAIETHLSKIKTFKIPLQTQLGGYVLYAKATYNGTVASASAFFKIAYPQRKLGALKAGDFFLIIVTLLVILVAILYKLKIIKNRELRY
ncbi:MAG: hypothetical protein QXP53_01005 [Candidatus Pacearchaeota archaeon]